MSHRKSLTASPRANRSRRARLGLVKGGRPRQSNLRALD
jgi:hypothetical protein